MKATIAKKGWQLTGLVAGYHNFKVLCRHCGKYHFPHQTCPDKEKLNGRH